MRMFENARTISNLFLFFFSFCFYFVELFGKLLIPETKGHGVLSRASRCEFAARHVRKRKESRVKIANASRGERGRGCERERERSFLLNHADRAKNFVGDIALLFRAPIIQRVWYGSAKRPALWSFSSCTPVETKRRNGSNGYRNSRQK